MITKIKINGFKSFHNFQMEFSPYTIIAGANAAGKSNLFDALMLLARLAELDNIKKAFREQRGEFLELFTQYNNGRYARDMQFEVEMLVSKTVTDAWGNTAELKYTRLKYSLAINRFTNASGLEDLRVISECLENLKQQDDKWIKCIPATIRDNWRPKIGAGGRGIPYIMTVKESGIPTVMVPQDGTTGNKRRFPLTNSTRTVLSSFDSVDFKHVLAAKEEMRGWRFLQLNPGDLRLPSSKVTGEDRISQSGKNLAGALFRLKQSDSYILKEISRKLQKFLPDFVSVDVHDDQENKQYVIHLRDKDCKEFTSRVLSEGTLRILALCILALDENHTGVLCFEEPENGIHPLRIRAMAELLKDLSTDFKQQDLPLRQVIINTHSPVMVGIINKWSSNAEVNIWFAKAVSRTTEVDGERTSLQVTEMDPVSKKDDGINTLPLTDTQQKLSITMVKEYLSTIEN